MKYFLPLILVLFISFNTQAQYRPFTTSALFNLGYASMQPEGEDVDLNGFTANFQYEYLNGGQFLAYGLSVSYAEGTGSNTTANYKYHSWPVTFMLKGFVGGDKVRGYLKGQAGFQSTTARKEGPNLITEAWDTGLTAGGGVGGNFAINDRLFVNLEYTANWIDSDFYDTQLIHTIQVGLGIQSK